MWRHTLCGVALFCGVMTGGCADASDEGTLPAPDLTTFEKGAFDNLPQLPRSEPFGARSEKNGVVTRTYRATGYTPSAVIDFYKRNLFAEGWTQAEPVYRADAQARGDWVNDDWRLEVSAAPIPDRQNPASTEAVVQYSLVLRPRS